MLDLRLFYFGQIIVVIDCCCFNYSYMAYVASKSDFQNKDRFENLSCSQCYPFSTTGNIVFAFEKSVIFTLGICITLIVIAAIWTMYIIFRKCRKNLWRAFGFALLVLIPAPIAITHISACFFPQVQFDFTSDIFNSGITLALSLVCFGVDYLLYHRKGDVTGKK